MIATLASRFRASRIRGRQLAALLAGLAVSSIVLAGNVTYTYDNAGRLKKVIHGNGSITEYGLDAAGNRTLVTTGPPDAVVPTTPGTLASSALSATSVRLTWTASTDTGGSELSSYRIERCVGAGCNVFNEIPNSAPANATSFDDTNVFALTTYRYQIRARDGAGNNSAYSNITSVTTPQIPDSTPPTTPVIQAVTAISSTRIDINWTASTDPGGSGVALYRIERCAGTNCSTFGEVDTIAAPATLYSDLTTAGTTSYTYRIRAEDGVGLRSAYSNIGGATTTDTLAPTVPGSLTATPASATQINLAWVASTEQGGGSLASYRIERCAGVSCSNFALVTHTLNVNFYDMSVAGSTVYRYQVLAIDNSSNSSAWSNIASATTPAAPDTTPPSPAPNTSATSPNSNTVNLTWTTSTDTGGSGFAGYKVWRCVTNCTAGYALLTTLPPGVTSYSDTTVSGLTWYYYYVTAYDTAGNDSGNGAVASIQTADTLAPTAPSGLSASAPTSTTVNLTWTASTDTGGSGLSGYRVERCVGASCSNFTPLASPSTASYSDTSVSGTTVYKYRVYAVDGSANPSTYSNTVQVTTPDTIAPTPPTIQAVSAQSSTRVDVHWTAGADTGGSGLSLYRIERCTGSGCSSFAEIGTAGSGATSYSDMTTAGTTTYVYRIRSQDGVGLLSGYSNVGGVTTTDTIGPTAPSGLTATATSTTNVALSWTGSVDQGGGTIASYRIERCTGAGCSNFALVTFTLNLSYNDSSVEANVTYNYRLGAIDNQSNPSGWSNTATVTTPYAPDTTIPTASNASAIAVSSSVINVSWTVSTDAGSGLAGYRLYRSIAPNGGVYTLRGTFAPGVNTFQDTGLAANTWHYYYVLPFDVAGNIGPYAGVGSVSTQP